MRSRFKLSGSPLSPEAALSELRRIQRHGVSIDDAAPVQGLSTITPAQAAVLAALNVKKPTGDAQCACCSGRMNGSPYTDQSLRPFGVELRGARRGLSPTSGCAAGRTKEKRPTRGVGRILKDELAASQLLARPIYNRLAPNFGVKRPCDGELRSQRRTVRHPPKPG